VVTLRVWQPTAPRIRSITARLRIPGKNSEKGENEGRSVEQMLTNAVSRVAARRSDKLSDEEC